MLLSMPLIAAEKTYVREYSYKASELDSKVSARKNALDQVKSQLLEEIATYVYSSSSSTQSLGADYQKQFVQNIKNVSAGFLGAKILEETWDGNIFWLRAELRANPDKILEELKTALNAPPAATSYAVADSATMPTYRHYVQKANLGSVVNMIMPIKVQMHEYYQSIGEWPTTFDELGLKQSDMRDGDLLDAVKLGKQGEMIMLLGKKFGDKKYFTLRPEAIMGGMNIKWVCKTNMPRTEVPMGMDCVIAP
jgi:hypothetical protein